MGQQLRLVRMASPQPNSESVLELPNNDKSGHKKNKRKQDSVSKRKASATGKKEKKQAVSETIEEPTAGRKRPKRAAACSDFKEKSVHLSKKVLRHSKRLWYSF